MDRLEHIELAHTYISASVRLEVDGIHQLAAEAVWGAVILAIEACRHAQRLGHGNFTAKRSFMGQLASVDTGQPDLGYSLHQAQIRLHNHFYTNRLSAEQASEWLTFGRAFVERLIRIAESAGNQAGTT